MTLHTRTGNPVGLSTLADVTDPIADPDPLLLITEDLVSRRAYGTGQTPSEVDRTFEAGGADDFEQVAFSAGQVVRTSEVTAYLSKPSVASVSPPSGPAGTRITVKGEGLDGTMLLNFGGVSVLGAAARNGRTIEFAAPAHATGPVALTITDDGGTVTVANAFTYTAAL